MYIYIYVYIFICACPSLAVSSHDSSLACVIVQSNLRFEFTRPEIETSPRRCFAMPFWPDFEALETRRYGNKPSWTTFSIFRAG